MKYDFATKTAIGIKGKPVKNLCSQLSRFTLDELFDCCDDEKYAKFLRFIRNSETYSYSISNIGTILDRVPRYDKFEQIFSAGFDDIIKDGYRFKYSINEIPKSLIKLCRKYPIKLSNNTVKYYKENQDAHYIAYNLDYLSLSSDDIYTVWNAEIYNGDYVYDSFFNKLVNEYDYNAKDLWLHGEKSVMMIEEYIKLLSVERYAIRWHMGWTEPKENYNTLGTAMEKYPLILALHEADLEATYLMEEKQ